MIRIFVSLMVLALAGSLLSSKANAVPPLQTCQSHYGNIWSEANAEIEKQEVDGKALKTPADILALTRSRKAGLKIIKGGDFSSWDMRGLSLSDVCFEESNLAGANLAGADGIGPAFIKSDLTGANLQGAIFRNILFRNANLTNVAAQGADFSGGQFDGGWFEGTVAGWNLDGANLTGFTFECGITLSDGCPVYQGGDPISAKGADFTKATLHSFSLYNMTVDGARLDDTIVGPAQLPLLTKADRKGDVIIRGGPKDIPVMDDMAYMIMFANAEQQKKNSKPSFDCSKARSKVENEICGEYGSVLRALDRDVAKLYALTKSNKTKPKPSQRRWLRERNKCNSAKYVSDCVRESYSQRKGELLGILGESNWLKPGDSALFVDEVLPLNPEIKRTGLYDEITPALIGASRTEILVLRQDDGLYSIRGSSVGANAHLCSLSASHLYFDKTSGWYVPVSEGSEVPIFRIFDERLEIFENGRPDYKQYPDAGNHMSCGARASFGETIRMNADEATFDKIRKSLEETM